MKLYRHLLHIFCFFCIGIIVVSCGGGGGDGREGAPQPPPPSPNTGVASGELIVPPNNLIEVEPNNTLAQAQPITETTAVSGKATDTDPGFPLPGFPGVVIADLFRFTSSRAVQITLTIAENNLITNDLDLLLLDENGNLLDVSEGFVATEIVETPGAGEFLIGIRAFRGASAYVFSLVPSGSIITGHVDTLPPEAEFVPGEILVKRKADKIDTQSFMSFASQYGLTRKEVFPPAVELFQVSLPPKALQQDERTKLLPYHPENALKALTLDSIRRLRQDPAVEYAEPNFIYKPSLEPNDEFFGRQWHYPLINLPQAWEITQGSNDIIVAVIDTGVLLNHPDLQGRLISGFDFISDPENANDGDGIDPDPTDPGDDPEGQSSSFHGTHVAGTIGAVTDNRNGVAGVTWQTRIMPLRVLGIEGGTNADIAQAIRYAAGLSNNSGTVPAERAHIINMSLGGPGFSQTLQNAVQAARNQGVVVVAAAGNENSSTFTSPASLDGVISVSAVDIRSQKASYSNFGSGIDVAAPGGDTRTDFNNDGFADGVLSTMGRERMEEIDFIFRFLAGTSMASPHVAGVIALMLAVNPNLTPLDIDQLLAGTHPATTIRITRDLGEPGRDDLYGHGLIDAAQAVLAAQSIADGGPILTGSILAVSTTALNFGNVISQLSFEITNAGTGTLQITEISANAPWLTLIPSTGIAPLTVNAVVDRSGLASGRHTATIQVLSDASQGDPTATISVEVEVGGETMGNVGTVFVLLLDSNTLDTVEQAITDATQNYTFMTPPVDPGSYLLVAGTDRDDDGFICDIEDACGFFPDLVAITAGQETAGITVVMGELSSPQSVRLTPGRFQAKTWKRRR